MSVTFSGQLTGGLSEPPSEQPSGQPAAARRVRHEVRDGMAVVGFSAVASCSIALLAMLLLRLVG